MWLYAEAWLPLLTIAIAAALCFGIASVFMGIPIAVASHSSLSVRVATASARAHYLEGGLPLSLDPHKSGEPLPTFAQEESWP